MSIKVVKVGTHGFFDVFIGDGWLNHVRIRMVKGNTLVIPDRYNMPDEVKRSVISTIRAGKTAFSSWKYKSEHNEGVNHANTTI